MFIYHSKPSGFVSYIFLIPKTSSMVLLCWRLSDKSKSCVALMRNNVDMLFLESVLANVLLLFERINIIEKQVMAIMKLNPKYFDALNTISHSNPLFLSRYMYIPVKPTCKY